MRSSAKAAAIFIVIIFLIFNGVQAYLIMQRFAAAKAKFSNACTEALQLTLFEYNKIKGTDTSTTPRNALVAFTLNEMAVNRVDSQRLTITSPTSRLYALRVDPLAVAPMINRPRTLSLDLAFFSKLYQRSLDSFKVSAAYRIDTFPVPFKTGDTSLTLQQRIDKVMASNRTNDFPFATTPQRIFFYPTALIFAEFKYDWPFFRNDLTVPLLGFFFILLISNTALVFVYRTIRKQKRLNEVKTDFINNITHEMKTPITIASAALDALQHHTSLSERSSFYLDTGKRKLAVLNDFVERILEAAVQDMPDLPLRKEKTDLHAMLEELLQSHAMLHGKAVHFHLEGEGPAYVMADKLHLETAFHNLVDNAVKYSNNNVQVDMELVEDPQHYLVRIKDNGIGIPPQYMKYIFEKFFRVPQGDSQEVKGFGLGLYYVHSIIKKHGGDIAVQSGQQSGTEFVITLPKLYDTHTVN